jgi:hypothetical protein
MGLGVRNTLMVLMKISELRPRAIVKVLMNLGKCLMSMIRVRPCNSGGGFELVLGHLCFVFLCWLQSWKIGRAAI